MRQQWLVGTAAIAVAVAAISLGTHFWKGPGTSGAGAGSAATKQASTAQDGYFCPMHPEVHQGKPGRCPICGMDLVVDTADAPRDGHPQDRMHQHPEALPAVPESGHESHAAHDHDGYGHTGSHDHQAPMSAAGPAMKESPPDASDRSSAQTSVHVPADVQRHMGIVLQTVRLESFCNGLKLPAQVLADERRAVSVSPKVEGWVKRLHVSAVGEPVRAGQVLYELYSPELLQRQREYLDILTRRDALSERSGGMGAVGNAQPDAMMSSIARERYRVRQALAAADLSEAVLTELERSRRVRDVIPVLAEHSGLLTSVSAREGMYVMPAQPVLTYADPRAAAVEIALSPEQLGSLGAKEEVVLYSTVDRSVKWRASVDRDRAIVDPVTRQARIRAALPDSSEVRRAFPAGTLVQAELRGNARRLISVPRDALVQAGESAQVIVAGERDHFRAVPVTVGADNGERIEIRSGLQAGDQVVVNGQFLIGAEASLQTARQRLRARARQVAQDAPPPGGQQGDHHAQ